MPMKNKKFHAFVVFGMVWGLGTLIVAGTMLVKIIGMVTIIAGVYLFKVIRILTEKEAQRDMNPEG